MEPQTALLPGTNTSTTLPVVTEEDLTKMKIINTRLRHTPTGRHEKILIRLSNLTVRNAIWEEISYFKAQLPTLPVWGQVEPWEGGDVNHKSERKLQRTPRIGAVVAQNPESKCELQRTSVFGVIHCIWPKYTNLAHWHVQRCGIIVSMYVYRHVGCCVSIHIPISFNLHTLFHYIPQSCNNSCNFQH